MVYSIDITQLRGISDTYYNYFREIFNKFKNNQKIIGSVISIKKNKFKIINLKKFKSIRGELLIAKRKNNDDVYFGYSFINPNITKSKQEFFYTLAHEFSHFILFLGSETKNNLNNYFEEKKNEIIIDELVSSMPKIKNNFEPQMYKKIINQSVITDNTDEILDRINNPLEYPICTLSRFLVLPTTLLLEKIDHYKSVNNIIAFFDDLYENYFIPYHVILQRIIDEKKIAFFYKKLVDL